MLEGITHEIKSLGKHPSMPRIDMWLVKLMYRNETKWFVELVEAPSELTNIKKEKLLSWLFHNISIVAPYATFQTFKDDLHPLYEFDRARNTYNSCRIVEYNLRELLKDDYSEIQQIMAEWTKKDDERIYGTG